MFFVNLIVLDAYLHFTYCTCYLYFWLCLINDDDEIVCRSVCVSRRSFRLVYCRLFYVLHCIPTHPSIPHLARSNINYQISQNGNMNRKCIIPWDTTTSVYSRHLVGEGNSNRKCRIPPAKIRALLL